MVSPARSCLEDRATGIDADRDGDHQKEGHPNRRQKKHSDQVDCALGGELTRLNTISWISISGSHSKIANFHTAEAKLEQIRHRARPHVAASTRP